MQTETLRRREDQLDAAEKERDQLRREKENLRAQSQDLAGAVLPADDPWLRSKRARAGDPAGVAQTTTEAVRTGCAKFARKDVQEAIARAAGPGEPEALDAATGDPALSRKQWQEWTDRLELSETDKAKVIARMNSEHERCKAGGSTKVTAK